MARIRKVSQLVLVVCVLILVALVQAQDGKTRSATDHFASIGFLEGAWEGTSRGKSGHGRVERTYERVMGGRFLHGRNTTVYQPNDKNPKGDLHEDWSLFSYDRARDRLVLRQFHIEGFVNQYVVTSPSEHRERIVFTSESIENIGPGWRARESCRLIGPDEFEELFELSAPGKDFEEYSKATLRRKK